MGRYKINIERRVLKLLGSQLYGDTPSVISEMVANSYDAGANNVWITLSKENDIIIEDDGNGMSVDEINERFLNIGYNKRQQDDDENKRARKPMGRKGIGKLAAFSLSNVMKVYSSKKGRYAGCIIDFKKITSDENSEPDEIAESEIKFAKEHLSKDGSGTRIELEQVSKKIAYSYRYIVNKLVRLFDVNDDDFVIYIKKGIESFHRLHRGDIDYFSIMDCIITVDRDDCYEKVKENGIEEKYKSIKKYSELLIHQTGKNKLKELPYSIVVEDKDGLDVEVQYSLNGWIGTVDSLPNLKKLQILEGDQESDQIEINDNRISLYSRGKMGEYDVLSKIKSNSNDEAYVVGEFSVDIFEDDRLADMAISNRRGYDETDPRYVETMKIIKRLLSNLMKQKRFVNKNRSEDREKKEAEEIKEKFIEDKTVKHILETKLDQEERDTLQNANKQFMRAVNVQNATRKIFISHKSEEKKFGQFIVDVLDEYGIDVGKNVIFTSDKLSRTGVPMGGEIFDYLKECFREDLLVVFLFSKAFYNSVACISEVGAAWATNKKSINVVIDIGFGDIEKPTINSTIGLAISRAGEAGERTALKDFFAYLIREGIGENPDLNKIEAAILSVVEKEYSSSNAFMAEKILPKSRFLPMPICALCNNRMVIRENGGSLVFSCTNCSCGNVVGVDY